MRPIDMSVWPRRKHFEIYNQFDYPHFGLCANVDIKKVVFSANKYISNGAIPGITHFVYVDPAAYSNLRERSELLAVGSAVSMLNKILPKRRFILMGPGRWGSRGDIKLGVNVTYSDINNTAMLIEIARKKRDYVP